MQLCTQKEEEQDGRSERAARLSAALRSYQGISASLLQGSALLVAAEGTQPVASAVQFALAAYAGARRGTAAIRGVDAAHVRGRAGACAPMGWPREAEFRELLERCERKASKGLLDELAALAVADDKQVRLNQPLSSQGGSSSGGRQCGVAFGR